MRVGTNQNGSGLVMILIAIAVLSFVALGIMTTRGQGFRDVQRINLHLSVMNAKVNLIAYLNNSSAWTHTKNDSDNSHLACLRPLVGTCSAGEADISVIRDGNNNVVFNGDDPSAGFKPSGEPCSDFVPSGGAGNPNCPLRPVIRWDPQCSGGPCTPTQIKLTVTFEINDGSGTAINTEPYKITLQRTP